jgi:hypothetical protein
MRAQLRVPVASDCPLFTVHYRAMKSRQNAKIKEIGDALRAAGYHSLNKQAEALGLCRSTAWTVLQAGHKTSGLTRAVLNCMLAAPKLPPPVRAKVLEYIAEKSEGLYGHSPKQRRRFRAALSARVVKSQSPPCVLDPFSVV